MSDDWPSAGTLLATRYRLVTLLETGGMAQIWHAQDELLGRPVAIKLPNGPQVAWREARLAAKLSHPSIAAVHDYREAVRTDGTVAPFVVMELLAGETVAARLVREKFGWPEAARVGAAVADALAAAHASGVVHRDIKPGNVMLTPNGVKILDFGISAAAGEPDDDDTGATFGTPAYVAPERLDGMPAVPATDVYGVGVLLFEMVTGDPPYPVDTWEELDEARKTGPSTLPLSLPADFRAVVERCLEDDPSRRPGADEIRFELTALWLADQPDSDQEPAAVGAPSSPAAPAVPVSPGRPSAGPAPAVPVSPGRPSAGAALPPARPRAAFADAHPGPRVRPDGTPAYPPGRSVVSGRAPAATLPMLDAPSRRRGLALALAVLALLAAVGIAYAVAGRPKQKNNAAPPVASEPATPLFSLEPSVAHSNAAPATPPSPKPTATLTFADAVSRMRTAIETDEGAGQIRPDVQTDILNFVRPLENQGTKDVETRLDALRAKINDRAGEGGLTPGQAAILRARLADLDRAAGM